jgi:translation initiation factor IF-3
MKLQFRKQHKLRSVIKHTFTVYPKAMMNNLKREDEVKIIFSFLGRGRRESRLAGRLLCP